MHRCDYTFNTGGNDGLGAGAGAAGGAAGLERDVERRAACIFASFLEGDDFGVVAIVVDMKTFADDAIIFYEYGADDGVGMRERDAAKRQRECAHHVDAVGVSNRRAS
jgi:hypothetical protein